MVLGAVGYCALVFCLHSYISARNTSRLSLVFVSLSEGRKFSPLTRPVLFVSVTHVGINVIATAVARALLPCYAGCRAN